jgi:pilus assembly protein Flp/PilA
VSKERAAQRRLECLHDEINTREDAKRKATSQRIVLTRKRKDIFVIQWYDRLVRFVKSEDGPTAVEYAVMLALIIVVCIAAITAVGGGANKTFSNVALNTAAGVSGS